MGLIFLLTILSGTWQPKLTIQAKLAAQKPVPPDLDFDAQYASASGMLAL